MIILPIYRQGDPAWGAKKLGSSGITMAEAGCFLTSAAMALHNFAIPDDPGIVCDKLNAVSGFTSSGFMTYDGLMRAYPQLYFKERIYTTNDPDQNIAKMAIQTAISRVKRLLKLGQPTILCVDLVGPDGNPDHAVVATEAMENDFWIQDPWTGTRLKFSERYGDPMKKLYGYVSVIGPPVDFPSDGDPQAGQALWKASQIVQGHNIATYARELIDTLI